MSPVERFMAKVSKDDSGCWLWTGCKQGNGYGRFRMGGKTEYAHRAAYQLFHGEIASGMDVCHRCDVRICCNPAHLFEGSRDDNMKDAMKKGRTASGERLSVLHQGEKSHTAKLTSDDVVRIRLARASGEKTKTIADRYGVGTDNIRRIVRRDTWRHI